MTHDPIQLIFEFKIFSVCKRCENIEQHLFTNIEWISPKLNKIIIVISLKWSYPNSSNICSWYVGVHCFLKILTAPSRTTASFCCRCVFALQKLIDLKNIHLLLTRTTKELEMPDSHVLETLEKISPIFLINDKWINQVFLERLIRR